MLGTSDPCLGIKVISSDIYRLIQELKCAEALLLVFNCHKQDIHKWVILKDCLLEQATSHREFSLLADLLEASSQGDLSQSVTKIPGLYSLLIIKNETNRKG